MMFIVPYTVGTTVYSLNKSDLAVPALTNIIEKVKERNRIYYKKYPNDIKRVRTILKHLSSKEVSLPNGGHLTPRRFLQLGLAFGGTGMSIKQSLVRCFSDRLPAVGGIDSIHRKIVCSALPYHQN